MLQPSTDASLHEDARAPVATFVVLALTLGLAQAVLHPFEQVTDEGGHFARAIRVATGDWFPRRGDLFAPASSELAGYLHYFYLRKLEVREQFPNDRVPFAAYTLDEYFQPPIPPRQTDGGREALTIGTQRLNPSHGYLGQAAFLTVANWFSDAPALHFYAARFGALAAGVIVTAAAIAILPAGRWIFVFGAMTPMLLIIRSSSSSDGMTVSLSWLLVALFVRACVRSERLRGREFGSLLACGIALALLKANLVLFPLLALLLPADRFDSAGRRWTAVGILVTLPAMAAVGWWNWLAVTDSTLITTPAPVAVGGLSTIVTQVPRFLIEAPNLLATYDWKWMEQFVGDYWSAPTYLTIEVPDWAVLLWAAVLTGLLATAPRQPRIGVFVAVVAGGLAVALLLGTMFLFWLGPHLGGPVDHNIMFMSGRYLHPALALAAPFALGLQALRRGPQLRHDYAGLHRALAIGGSVVLVATSFFMNLRMNLGWPA